MTVRRSPDDIIIRDVPAVPGHDGLTNRNLPNQHPISAITGLTEVIESLRGGDGNPMEYTVAEKTKLAGIEAGAEANVISEIKVNGTALVPASGSVSITIPEPAVPGFELVDSAVWSGYLEPADAGYCTALADLMIVIRTEYGEDTIYFTQAGSVMPAKIGYPYITQYDGETWMRRLAHLTGLDGEINDTPVLAVSLGYGLASAPGTTADPPGLQIAKRTEGSAGTGIYLYARE